MTKHLINGKPYSEMKKKKQSNKIEILDVWLKPKLYPAITITNDMAAPGSQIGDFKSVALDVRLIGTEKQIDDYLLDKMTNDNWEIKDNWEFHKRENPKEWKRMMDLYHANGKKILHLNLK